MTHDYISWVLGLQGWERAHCEDNYFAGEEDTIDNAVSDETIDGSLTVEVCRQRKETACQTPPEWGKSPPISQVQLYLSIAANLASSITSIE